MKVCAWPLSGIERGGVSQNAQRRAAHYLILMVSWFVVQIAINRVCPAQSGVSPGAILMFAKTDPPATANHLEFRKPLRRTTTVPDDRQQSGGMRYGDFQGCPIDDRKCELLARIPTLEVLVLICTRITDSGLKPLRRLRRLRELDLRGTRISNRAVAHIVRMVNLRIVDVRGTRMTANGIARLRAARPELLVLTTGGCR